MDVKSGSLEHAAASCCFPTEKPQLAAYFSNMRLHTMVKLHEQGPTVPGKLPRQRQQPFQLRVADTASPYRIADIFGEVLVVLIGCLLA